MRGRCLCWLLVLPSRLERHWPRSKRLQTALAVRHPFGFGLRPTSRQDLNLGLPYRLALANATRRPNMRIFAQDRAFYRKVRVGLGDHPETARRFELLPRVERARGMG